MAAMVLVSMFTRTYCALAVGTASVQISVSMIRIFRMISISCYRLYYSWAVGARPYLLC